jgi:hypothetical protein
MVQGTAYSGLVRAYLAHFAGRRPRGTFRTSKCRAASAHKKARSTKFESGTVGWSIPPAVFALPVDAAHAEVFDFEEFLDAVF